VFEARHIDLHKRVALKVTHPTLVLDDRSIERALREGRAATAIHHPHVVDVLDVGVEDRTPYLVMELLDGEHLADHLARTGSLSVQETANLLLPVVSAVGAVHRAGIIHRDLKPSNILLARRHRGVEPVLVDFGISRSAVPQAESPAWSDGVVGTAPYMSPEQIRGLTEATPVCDQYALGVILYECVTGGTPFWSDDRYELLHAVMTAQVVPPSQVNPLIPSTFDAMVLRALARDPTARFASVHLLGEALWPFCSPEHRATWSAEFGAPEAMESAETTAPLVGYSRASRGSSRAGPRLRAAGSLVTAIGCAVAIAVFAGRTRGVGGKADPAAAGTAAVAPLDVTKVQAGESASLAGAGLPPAASGGDPARPSPPLAPRMPTTRASTTARRLPLTPTAASSISPPEPPAARKTSMEAIDDPLDLR